MSRVRPARLIVATSMVLVLAAAASGCSRGGGQAAPSPTASPSPAPTRDVQPVNGEAQVQAHAVSNEEAVWDRAMPAVDEAAVQAVADRVTGWLDEHLTDLQSGGDGALDAVAAPGLLDGADEALVDAVTSALAGPERPVGSATYDIVVAHTDTPQWVRATATVTGGDAGDRTAQFVFEVAADSIVLIAAGPGSGQGPS